MTHKDIYTKFMIEYDKANVTSSYPSLTEYEVATVLDKAYNALIAQKVTGNNVRRAGFENDVKAIADLSPLVTTSEKEITKKIMNVVQYNVPVDMLYFVQAVLRDFGGSHKNYDRFENEYDPMDGITGRNLPVKLVSHDMAQKFIVSAHNIPWIKTPVCYIEDNTINVVYDPLSIPNLNEQTGLLSITYIRKPNTFVKDFYSSDFEGMQNFTYFKEPDNASPEVKKLYTFECNDTVAEELISLAVAFALENVESSRLNAKLNMRGLEA